MADRFRKLLTAKQIPQWTDDSSLNEYFIRQLERVLRLNAIPENKWYMVFGHITDDLISNDWIYRNIIESKEVITSDDSWKAAHTAFTDHFMKATITEDIIERYYQCHQKANESVQTYGDRLSTLVKQRGFDNDEPTAKAMVLEKFINGLNHKMKKDYLSRVQSLEDYNPDMVPTNLEDAISYAIRLGSETACS